ncbi:24905_t:CDS:2 [Cetraspora pellucida]|uniref:24905_t:CDS:1 n=1 Tax=Cetraspora pellucida TaxID=1433469 RepID=A0A9N9J139_9GLOM|nr:24905_t:CDS:2 [Cetraspora pellucida]
MTLHFRQFAGKPTKIAICNSCKNPKTRKFLLILSSILQEISLVPMHHRKYLSPVHMTCLLGCTPGSNPYTTYQFLQDEFFLNKNIHSLEFSPSLSTPSPLPLPLARRSQENTDTTTS